MTVHFTVKPNPTFTKLIFFCIVIDIFGLHIVILLCFIYILQHLFGNVWLFCVFSSFERSGLCIMMNVATFTLPNARYEHLLPSGYKRDSYKDCCENTCTKQHVGNGRSPISSLDGLNCAIEISPPPPCLYSLHQWHGGSQALERQPDPIQWDGQEGRQWRQPGGLRRGRRRPVQRGWLIHRPIQREEGKRHGGGQREFGGSFSGQRHELLCVTAWKRLVTFDPSNTPPPCHTIIWRTVSCTVTPLHHSKINKNKRP